MSARIARLVVTIPIVLAAALALALALLLAPTACSTRGEEIRVGRRVEIERSRGAPATVRGEVVHVYDLTYDILHPDRHGGRFVAVFDATRASERREADRAFDLIPEDAIARVSSIASPEGPSFADFARARGLVVDELPLGGVWRVHEDGSGYHAHEGGCGDFALDLDGGDPGGARNEDFAAFGRPVHAPVAGRVSVAVGDRPDHDPTTIRGATPANALFLDLGGAFSVGMYHLAAGSLLTTTGAAVERGAPLGRVGNSGTSYAPHLHLGLYWRGAGAPAGSCHGWSVPFVFRRLYVSTLPNGAALAEWTYPRTGTWVSNAPF